LAEHTITSVATPLRIDPAQRFTCASCGRCCHRAEVAVTQGEVEAYRRKNAAAWFREGVDGSEGTERDPFEAFPQWPGLFRIRKRADGACGFLSATNRCRLHEELGADRKPLTCRMFPYSFHAAPDAVVAIASFACPTIVANEGRPPAIDALEALRKEWGGTRMPAARELVKGRPIDGRSIRIVRDSLLAVLGRDAGLRENIRRIALALDDLTRHRVLQLSDADFAEYVSLTLPYAATAGVPAPPRAAGRIGRLLQYGFLYTVAATRLALDGRDRSRFSLRLARLQLLAHFHGLAPGVGRVNVRALGSGAVDIEAADIRPIVFHYLRSSLEALGARDRPLVDDLAIAVSCLNAAGSLAVMNAAAEGRAVDRQIFIQALMEAVDLSHADDRGLLRGILQRLAGGTEALWFLQSPLPGSR
jgi:Fe-S-cluster containining protein